MKPSRRFLWFCLALLFGFIIAMGITALLMLSGMDDTAMMMLAQEITQVLVFLVPGLVVALLAESPRAALKLGFNKSVLGAALVSAVAFILLLPCLDILTEWNDSWGIPHGDDTAELMLESWLMRPGWGAFAVNLLVVALTPAICEEFFFRCGLQQLMLQWLRPVWAVVLSAAIFSLAHGEFYAFVPRFIMGLVLGMLFLRTGSMWVNITCHFANNALVVVSYTLFAQGATSANLAEGMHLHWALACLCTVASIALFAVVCGYPKIRKSNSPTT